MLISKERLEGILIRERNIKKVLEVVKCVMFTGKIIWR